MTQQTIRNTSLRFLSSAFTVATLLAASLVYAEPAEATPTGATISSVIPRESRGWSYYQGSLDPSPTWQTDTGGWATGQAPFGKGVDVGRISTSLPSDPGEYPLAAYFRKSFTLSEELPDWAWLNTWADDGIVVWVNGVEIGRKNAPDGRIDPTSYATSAPSTSAARSDPVTFSIPVKLLKPGQNVLAVQVLSNWRRTPNISFDAHLVREDGSATQDVPTTPAPPPPPTSPPAQPAPPPTPPAEPDHVPGWGTPTWQDEFTYTDPRTGQPTVDPGKWNIRGRDDLGLLFDAAVVDRGQVSVDGSGVLHIRADWLDRPVVRPPWQSGPDELWHKTGYLDQRRLDTDDVSFGQVYGRWEIRAKTPSGPNTFGSLSAFWLRNEQSGEIDVMEAWGYDETAVRDQRIDTATTTTHTHTSTPSKNTRYIWHHADYGAPTPVWQDFHTYAFEYTPAYAAVIVDGEEILRVTPSTHPSLWDPDYFGSPLHMRLNLHVGASATYWGLPDPTNRSATQDLDLQVDYVRVWTYAGD